MKHKYDLHMDYELLMIHETHDNNCIAINMYYQLYD